MTLESYGFRPDLNTDMAAADLIMSHCGAGTILEILRMNKKAVGVINDQLLDNHQVELADAMHERGLMVIADSPDRLLDTLKTTAWDKLNEYGAPNPTLFVDELSSLIKL